jgi:diguanylate cyclase (GGDEF)-like protein
VTKRPDDGWYESDTSTAPLRGQEDGQKRPYLLVLSGPQFGQIFRLEPGREFAIGRKEGVDILVRDDGVSRRHASVLAEGGGARIRDLGSQNGTFVNGVRVTDCRLDDGDRVHIGVHSTLKFCYSDELEAEYQRKLAEGALHEPLTGLYNRRHFMERLGAELAAAQRHQRSLSLLFVDIDHFKRVNDAHGHLAGDDALKMIAHVMQGALRREDVLARHGGEEFVVLARDTPLAGARALGERMRKAVERSRLSWQGQDLALTISIGVTAVVAPAEYQPGKSELEILDAADRALYQAKQAGRNCVVALPPPVKAAAP